MADGPFTGNLAGIDPTTGALVNSALSASVVNQGIKPWGRTLPAFIEPLFIEEKTAGSMQFQEYQPMPEQGFNSVDETSWFMAYIGMAGRPSQPNGNPAPSISWTGKSLKFPVRAQLQATPAQMIEQWGEPRLWVFRPAGASGDTTLMSALPCSFATLYQNNGVYRDFVCSNLQNCDDWAYDAKGSAYADDLNSGKQVNLPPAGVQELHSYTLSMVLDKTKQKLTISSTNGIIAAQPDLGLITDLTALNAQAQKNYPQMAVIDMSGGAGAQGNGADFVKSLQPGQLKWYGYVQLNMLGRLDISLGKPADTTLAPFFWVYSFSPSAYAQGII